MLTPPNYYADGQQREEVYVWNSFLQTEMYQKGVTCMDCHEPHSLKLRAEGNALCTRCHNAAVFDTEKHHFHKAGTTGRAMRRVPHAGAELHGDRRAARSRHPRAAARPVDDARQPECLHAMPRRTASRNGRRRRWTSGTARTGAREAHYGTTLHAGDDAGRESAAVAAGAGRRSGAAGDRARDRGDARPAATCGPTRCPRCASCWRAASR